MNPKTFGASTRSSHAGKPFDTSLWKNPLLPMPDGKRSMVSGRARRCGSSNGAIAS